MEGSTGPPVAIVGVGAMGGAMAEQILDAGFPLRFYARRPTVVEAMVARGAVAATSLRELSSGCSITIVCVFNDAQVREVVLEPGGVAEGVENAGTVVVHTTCRPESMDLIAEALSDRGGHAVDAPVSGSPVDARIHALTLLVGGDDDAVLHCRPVMECYGSPILHVGPVGHGQRVKLVNNVLLAASVRLLREAVELGEAMGVDQPTLTLGLASASSTSRAIEIVNLLGSFDAFADSVGPFLAKDVVAARDAAAASGMDLGLLGQLASGEEVSPTC